MILSKKYLSWNNSQIIAEPLLAQKLKNFTNFLNCLSYLSLKLNISMHTLKYYNIYFDNFFNVVQYDKRAHSVLSKPAAWSKQNKTPL